MGYTGGSYRQSPTAANSQRIDRANKGKRVTLVQLLEMVEIYIRTTALRPKYGGDVNRVPCPPPGAWSVLSSGRSAQLPSETQMALCARQPMRDLAAAMGGDIRRAYFAVARRRILDADASRSR